MADRIIQPKMVSADGKTSDNLIFYKSVNSTHATNTKTVGGITITPYSANDKNLVYPTPTRLTNLMEIGDSETTLLTLTDIDYGEYSIVAMIHLTLGIESTYSYAEYYNFVLDVRRRSNNYTFTYRPKVNDNITLTFHYQSTPTSFTLSVSKAQATKVAIQLIQLGEVR